MIFINQRLLYSIYVDQTATRKENAFMLNTDNFFSQDVEAAVIAFSSVVAFVYAYIDNFNFKIGFDPLLHSLYK